MILFHIIGQLVPASADYTADILNTVESHVLEETNTSTRIPMMAFTSSTEGVAFGAEELRYNWDRNHAPVSGLEKKTQIGGRNVQNAKALSLLGMRL